MNDRQRRMLDWIDRAKTNEGKAGNSKLVIKDLNRMARIVEAESALSSPSCDFASSTTETIAPVHYLALFVDKECLERVTDHLDRSSGKANKKVIEAPHVTLMYRPLEREVPRELFGKDFTLVIDGYGYNEENEAFRVRLQPDVGAADFDLEACDAVQKMLDGRDVQPHITLSVADGGKAVNSKNLRFDPIEPISIGCVFGAHLKLPEAELVKGRGKVSTEASTDARKKYRMRRQTLDELLASMSGDASLNDDFDQDGPEDDGVIL